MALDEALLQQCGERLSPPTLRLYSWNVPTLSLGMAQSISEVNLDQINQLGWGLVRRPTGGKAILHVDEITYSICAPLDDALVAGSLLDSYCRISKGLQKALASLNIETAAAQQSDLHTSHDRSNPVCFEVPSNYEITWNGKKIIGSAQARKAGGVLQHGSIPLCGDITRILTALNFNTLQERQKAAEKLRIRACTLYETTGRMISWEEVARALVEAFTQEFNVEFTPCQPSDQEISLMHHLEATKYNHPTWTHRL